MAGPQLVMWRVITKHVLGDARVTARYPGWPPAVPERGPAPAAGRPARGRPGRARGRGQRRCAAAGPAASASGGAHAAVQLVRYHGYQIQVPASWPVYHLAADPARCVLFSAHAVYLGTPGPDQQCPAHAVGRTSAVLIQPAGAPSQLPVGTAVLPSSTAALPARAVLPAASAAATAAGHALRLVVSRAGVLVTAAYGGDPAQARQILASARATGTASTSTPAPAPARPQPASPQPRGPPRPVPSRRSRRRPSPPAARRDPPAAWSGGAGGGSASIPAPSPRPRPCRPGGFPPTGSSGPTWAAPTGPAATAISTAAGSPRSPARAGSSSRSGWGCRRPATRTPACRR